MTPSEKIQAAFRIAGEEFDAVYGEVFLTDIFDAQQWATAKLRAIGPMAAEIYRESNRLVVVNIGENKTPAYRRRIISELQKSADYMSASILITDDPKMAITDLDSDDVRAGGAVTE